MIWAERKAGQFSLSHFYARPGSLDSASIVFVMLSCVAPAVWLLSPAQLKDFFQTVTASSLFYSNVFLATHSSYFDLATESRPLLHTWSLAVRHRLKPTLALNSGRCVLRFFVSLMIYPFLWTVSHLNTSLKFGVLFTI